MTHWWNHRQEVLTPEECAEVRDYALALPAQAATVGITENRHNEHMRRSTVRWLKRDDPALQALFGRLARVAERVNEQSFGFDLRGFDSAQFTEYDASNSGHYDWHIDNQWRQSDPLKTTRKLSMVIQLSPPFAYHGGALELENDPLPSGVFTQQGSAIFFPSFNKHRVTPVTSGTRHSLVIWFQGPPFR